MYTLCTINEELLQAESYPKLKSITHLCTFSDIGVYVALQLILIIVVSDQWYQVLITLLLSTGALGSFTYSGMVVPIYVVGEP